MIAALLVLGSVAEAAAWWVVRRGASLWTTLAPVLVAMGALALATGRVRWTEASVGGAVAVGLLSGLALYAATQLFLRLVAPRWPALPTHARETYAPGAALPRWAAIAISAALVAPGEELFWRGLLVPELDRALGRTAAAAALAWAASVLASVPSRNLAILAGAAVGGAAWVALAVWSGGVLAPVVCHAVWTGLMLAAPPIPSAGEAPGVTAGGAP